LRENPYGANDFSAGRRKCGQKRGLGRITPVLNTAGDGQLPKNCRSGAHINAGGWLGNGSSHRHQVWDQTRWYFDTWHGRLFKTDIPQLFGGHVRDGLAGTHSAAQFFKMRNGGGKKCRFEFGRRSARCQVCALGFRIHHFYLHNLVMEAECRAGACLVFE
jgi:hypothetical protein